MEIELDPPRGAAGFPIGMAVDHVVPEAVRRGRVVITDPDQGGIHHMKVDLTVYLGQASLSTVLALEDGRTLSSIELHAPRRLAGGPDAADAADAVNTADAPRVTWRGIDVFATPALEVLERIEAQGYEIDRGEAPDHYTVPALPLGFTRTAGHKVPKAEDGAPRYMQSVLVAGEGYYDRVPEFDFSWLGPKPLEHRFVIDPPRGLDGFPFGMPMQELIAATTPLGHVRIEDPGQNRPDLYTKLFLIRPSFTAIFACEDGYTLTAVELWAPESAGGGGQDRIAVHVQGIDVFATPALEVLDRLTARGYTLDDTDPDYPKFPQLALGFTRTRGHEVPKAPDARPEFFQAVLTALPGYYDHPLPPSPLEGGEPWKSRMTRPAAH